MDRSVQQVVGSQHLAQPSAFRHRNIRGLEQSALGVVHILPLPVEHAEPTPLGQQFFHFRPEAFLEVSDELEVDIDPRSYRLPVATLLSVPRPRRGGAPRPWGSPSPPDDDASLSVPAPCTPSIGPRNRCAVLRPVVLERQDVVAVEAAVRIPAPDLDLPVDLFDNLGSAVVFNQ